MKRLFLLSAIVLFIGASAFAQPSTHRHKHHKHRMHHKHHPHPVKHN